jgi:hypothetical protein
MKVKFLRNVTIDFVDRQNIDAGDKMYHRNECIDVDDVIPVSSTFYNVVLPSGTTLLDLRKDWFEKVD